MHAIKKYRMIRGSIICDAYMVEASLTNFLRMLFRPTLATEVAGDRAFAPLFSDP